MEQDAHRSMEWEKAIDEASKNPWLCGLDEACEKCILAYWV